MLYFLLWFYFTYWLVPSDTTVLHNLLPGYYMKFMKRRQFANDEKVFCMANCWPKNQYQKVFYNDIEALEKATSSAL